MTIRIGIDTRYQTASKVTRFSKKLYYLTKLIYSRVLTLAQKSRDVEAEVKSQGSRN